MTGQTITIKFGGTSSQSARLRLLAAICERLLSAGRATEARAEAVFPGDADPEMSALFTVQVLGGPTDASRWFRAAPGVEFAQQSGVRRSTKERTSGTTKKRASRDQPAHS